MEEGFGGGGSETEITPASFSAVFPPPTRRRSEPLTGAQHSGLLERTAAAATAFRGKALIIGGLIGGRVVLMNNKHGVGKRSALSAARTAAERRSL